MLIKLIRHAQSEQQAGIVNATQLGDHKVSITEEGKEKSRRLGQSLDGEFVARSLLYTSTYLRSRQTMYEMIGPSGADAYAHVNSTKELRVYEDVRLREMEWGFNKQPDEIDAEEEYRKQFDWFYYRLKGGESPADVYDRVSSFIESLHRQFERKRKNSAIIVTHGITIRCFVMRWLHLSVENFIFLKNPKNCDVVTITDKNYLKNPQFVRGKWGIEGLRLRNGA